ncbi:hypothetical protein PYCC9005_004697 [Savitreella phatthalungensis]
MHEGIAVHARDRFDTPLLTRLALLSSLTGATCFGIGLFQGAKTTSYQFLAENAHRLPRTHQGWYFYHKTKNYRVMWGGLKGGARYAWRTTGWTLLFAGLEAGVDVTRAAVHKITRAPEDQSKPPVDFISTMLAAGTTAWLLSRKHGFSRQLTRRTVRLGTLVGAGAGILQDILTVAKGRGDVWYLNRALELAKAATAK